MTGNRVRSIFAALVAALALPLVQAQPPRFDADKSAPLLQRIYESPLPEDRAEAWKVIAILEMTRFTEDAERVRTAHERRQLQRMLGEPLGPARSVQETIAREAKEKDGLQPLRDRLRGRLTVARDDAAEPEDLSLSPPGAYQGHGVWIGPTTEAWQKNVTIRVKIDGALAAAPMASFDIEVASGEAGAPDGWRMRFTCFPDEASASPTRGRRATCNNRYTGIAMDAALEALVQPRLRARIRVTGVDTPLLRVADSRTVFDEDTQGRQKALELLQAASCTELGTCGLAAPAAKPPPQPRTPVFEAMKLDLDSAFFREIRARPFPDSREELETMAFVFDRTGNWAPGSRLRDWADLRDLRAMMGEPFQPPATIGDALTGDLPEGAFALRKRALRSVLSVDREPSRGDEATYNGPIEYLGESVWRGGHSGLLLWLRVRATNHHREPIEGFYVHFRHSSLVLLSFDCKAEEGAMLPPGKAAVAICHNNTSEPKPPEAVEHLRKASIPAELELITVRLPAFSFGTQSRVETRGPGQLERVQVAAREMIESTPCEKLNACAQVAKHRERAIERPVDWRTEQAQRERHSAERLERGRQKALFALVASLVFTVLLAGLGSRGVPASRGVFPTILAGWTVVAATVVGMASLAILLEGDRLGYGGFVVIFVWMYGGPALLLGLIALGIAMMDRRRWTPIRMGSLGFGLSAVLLTAVSFLDF